MSQKDVERRNSTNNRRKNTDGDRTDSGCFEDVDVLQMANRQCQTSGPPITQSSDASDKQITDKCELVTEEDCPTGSAEVHSAKTPSNHDECVDDAEYRAILERLAELTQNPGDLYRLCFSSRLSFGLPSGVVDEEGSLPRPTDCHARENQPGICGTSVVRRSSTVPETDIQQNIPCVLTRETENKEVEHQHCESREQCVELLSLLSSFVGKAKENPAVFSQSDVGKALLGQLSSLLTTLEQAKKNPCVPGSSAQSERPNQSSLNCPQQPSSGENTDWTSENLVPEQLQSDESENVHAELLSNDTAATTETPRVYDKDTESTVSIGQNNEVSVSPVRLEESDPDFESLERADLESGDVVSNGRRAVKPYSWDYGDIWEKELQRAQSTDSFQAEGCGSIVPGKNIPGDRVPHTFEEIRDELFHDAGFVLDDGNQKDTPKRRSRSADARPRQIESELSWFESFADEQPANSPFVRTVYQQGYYPNSSLTRSRSSHRLEGNSITINVDQAQGRRVLVYPENPESRQLGQLDDAWALIVKEAVVRTSTFRGPKPWSVLKRRPSGLRRRSNGATRSESLRSERGNGSNKFLRTRLNSHGDSESSDSPYYVSAASSDCLTTDDSSSITSSHLSAASSSPSSPTVSNRNSACFSDLGSSDLSDLRRIVFQDSSPGSYPGNSYRRRHRTPNRADRFVVDDEKIPGMQKWAMSLNERFGLMDRNNYFLSEPDEYSHLLKITAKRPLRKSYQRAGDFRGSDSTLQNLPSSVGTRWPLERLVKPMLARSDSSLNSLTKVQFLGDSYSRSHISKNVRCSRKASRSLSPGPQSTYTRVVSCEIVQSDKDKRDVYTKVSLSRSAHDEATAPTDNPNPWCRNSNTRRSWHGHSPTRGFSRLSRTNSTSSPRRTNSERYVRPSGLVNLGRQVFRPQRSEQVDKPLQATLVEVQSICDCQMSSHNSTGSLRSACGSDDSRAWSDSRVPSGRRGYHGMLFDDPRQFQRSPMLPRNGSFGLTQTFYDRPSNPGIIPGRGRLSPNQLPMANAQLGISWSKEKDMVPSYNRQVGFQNFEIQRNPSEKIRLFERNSQKTSISKGIAKEPVTHVVKETSFVGPSTFTKYQAPSSPSSLRMRRSKSFNEKDSVSRRRLQESDFYRRRALEIASGDPNIVGPTNYPLTGESNFGVVRRPERRRRYSEGGCKPSGIGGGPYGDVVDQSYCDPRRESIREGTYSVVSAESARNASKAGNTRPETVSINGAGKDDTLDPELTEARENGPDNLQIDTESVDDCKNGRKPEQVLSNDDIDLTRKNVETDNNKQMENMNYEKVQASVSDIQPGSTIDNRNNTATNLLSNDPDVLPVRLRINETPVSSNGVSVFIDYRNKRPVSVEYASDASVESQPGDSTKPSKLSLLKKGKGRTKQSAQPKSRTTAAIDEHLPSSVADVQISIDSTEEDNPRQRLSRRDKHEQEILSNLGKGNEINENKETKTGEVPPEPSSPTPYSRDKSIVYTDARSSIKSDTDSISLDSTVSSSGSEMTVILNDDKDISAGDLRQLTQSSSKIGIEIGSLELDCGDDLLDSSDSTTEKNSQDSDDFSTTLDDAVRSGNDEYSASIQRTLDSRALPEETGDNRNLSCASKGVGNNQSFVYTTKESSSDWKADEPFKQDSKLKNMYLKDEKSVGRESVYTTSKKNADSPMSSNTTSSDSGKGIGTSSSDGSKGKHSSGKNGDGVKGLFSRLKNIRHSFRGKKNEGKSHEKSGKASRNSTKNVGKWEKRPDSDIRRILGTRSLTRIDDNSNEMSERTNKPRIFNDRATSSDFCTRVARKEVLAMTDDKSQRLNEALRQSGATYRRVVGVKSVSSDHLNSLRINQSSGTDISAKSLEVLLETCI